MMTQKRPPIADVEQIIADAYPGPHSLAAPADTYSPDSETSPGAVFLMRVRNDVAEHIAYRLEDEGSFDLDTFNDEDRHEIADSAVPIYTAEMWATFVDLGAWQEDPSELGFDASDMEQAAKVCLYMIAERLASDLADHVAAVLADIEPEDDDEDPED